MNVKIKCIPDDCDHVSIYSFYFYKKILKFWNLQLARDLINEVKEPAEINFFQIQRKVECKSLLNKLVQSNQECNTQILKQTEKVNLLV